MKPPRLREIEAILRMRRDELLRDFGVTQIGVFGSCVRASQHGGTNFLLLARNGEGPPDLARLARGAARARFGERPGTAEWERLLDHGAVLAADAAVVAPRADRPVLTDEDAPLEWMTDRFLRENEERVMAGGGPDVAALRALDRRQSWLLGVIALCAAAGAGVGFRQTRRYGT